MYHLCTYARPMQPVHFWFVPMPDLCKRLCPTYAKVCTDLFVLVSELFQESEKTFPHLFASFCLLRLSFFSCPDLCLTYAFWRTDLCPTYALRSLENRTYAKTKKSKRQKKRTYAHLCKDLCPPMHQPMHFGPKRPNLCLPGTMLWARVPEALPK